MVRSIWKGNSINFNYFHKKIGKYGYILLLTNKNIKLLPCFLNKKICVYNGKRWMEFAITSSMLFFNLGCFLYTRSLYVVHNLKKNRKKQKNKNFFLKSHHWKTKKLTHKNYKWKTFKFKFNK